MAPIELDTSRVELVSPLGRTLYAQVDREGVVAPAEAAVREAPTDLERLFALGRAYHRVWRYHDAVDTYTRAVEVAPDNPLTYRHRGHRYISIRRFDRAIADLERAAELDDRSFDIWYHLGLARYLVGDFARAAEAYRACLAVSDTDDKVVAVADWLSMTLRRLGREADARAVLDGIHPEMQYGENIAYFNRLLVYKGLKDAAELMRGEGAEDDLHLATEGYGLANWHLYHGRRDEAIALFRRITDGAYWPAFGFIAAEAELVRGV